MMDRTFEIHKDTVAVQSPLAGISTTDPTAMEPSVYIDKEKTNPMDSSPDINTAIDKMTVKEDEEGTLDSNPPEPSPRGKIKRNKFVEYKESDLPDTEARLTDDQISLLFSTRPDVRKRYTRYFRANGHISINLMRLLFERDESGNLRHSEDILRSNVQNWQKKHSWGTKIRISSPIRGSLDLTETMKRKLLARERGQWRTTLLNHPLSRLLRPFVTIPTSSIRRICNNQMPVRLQTAPSPITNSFVPNRKLNGDILQSRPSQS